MNNGSYLFDDRVVLRTPRFPLTESISPENLLLLLQQQAFLEAIYLASPVLYDECIKWKEGRIQNPKDIHKLTRSLGKYFLRMSSRPTPFGLFSGLGMTQWCEEDGETLSPGPLQRHTRLDMNYLCALSQRLVALPFIRIQLRFFVNSSIYSLSDELRYVECYFVEGRQLNQICSVNDSDALQKILHTAGGGGANIDALCKALVEDGFGEEESLRFVEELIDAQVIVSELLPAITGMEYLDQLIGILGRINEDPQVKAIQDTLLEAKALLHQIDHAEVAGGVEPFRRCIRLLSALEAPIEEGKFFQTDMFRVFEGKGISTRIRTQLEEVLDVVNRLGMRRPHPSLENFIRQFQSRYEDREMPLLEVLDSERGIGYADAQGGATVPLVEDLVITAPESNVPYSWTVLEDLLQKKMLDMYLEGSREINLTEGDLRNLERNWDDLPASFQVMFRVVKDGRVLLENVGGSSAVNLLGRFAHADAGVRSLAEDIARKEQALDPGVVYAEIVHLPESRMGNILLHPVFRAYEIPYLAQASVDADHQIDISDLYVSIRQNRIVLRSRKLGKEILPRLSTAHNYAGSALPIYRFLCDLQLQGKRGSMTFHWGSLKDHHRFLPRVSFKEVILHPARWVFTPLDVQHPAFRKDWNLPRFVVLADGDNELLIDLEDEGMVQILAEAVKNRSEFVLREFLHPDTLVTDEAGRPFVNQCIGVVTRTVPVYKQAVTPERPLPARNASTRTQFLPGSEWVYYKLYTGAKTADKILLEYIRPLMDSFSNRGWTDQWFFIRYNDPEFHIRLRCHLTHIKFLGPVTAALHAALEPLLDDRLIWKAQMDTYSREIERYGAGSMELAEALFHQSSLSVTGMLGQTYGDERESVRWVWALGEANQLLECFGFSEEGKLELITRLRDGFAREFPLDKMLRQQLSNKYRKHRAEIYEVMEKSHGAISPLRTIADQLLQMELQVPLPELIGSYLHMMINRVAIAQPRKQEMVIYDLLVRYYQSSVARMKEQLPSIK